MYLVVFITVPALLYKLIVKDRLGRIRQTVTLKAKRVNVVILNDNHTNATTTGNRTRNWARQQHICQVEDSEAEESNEHVSEHDDDNDLVRGRLINYLVHRHFLSRLEGSGGEYVEADEETISNDEMNEPPAYEDAVKEEVVVATDNDE